MRERPKNDPRPCDMLIPKDYGLGTHRVPLEDGFLEASLRPNAEAVSVGAIRPRDHTRDHIETALCRSLRQKKAA
jgi:acetone monooxygenase (methyl acetate-forming)